MVNALLDEPAHLITVVLALGAINLSLVLRHWLPLLIGGVLIDADHIPAMLGMLFLTRGAPRPYTHSFLTIAVVLLVALLCRGRWRKSAGVVAYALAWHFFRDMVEGGAVSLLWPWSSRGFVLPYQIYAAAMGLLALVWTARAYWVVRSQ